MSNRRALSTLSRGAAATLACSAGWVAIALFAATSGGCGSSDSEEVQVLPPDASDAQADKNNSDVQIETSPEGAAPEAGGETSLEATSEQTPDSPVEDVVPEGAAETSSDAGVAKAEVLWNHHVPNGEGPVRNSVAIGNKGQYVFTGGWSGGGKMYEMKGNGTPLWETPELGGTGVAAARTVDLFYAALWSPPPGDAGDFEFSVRQYHGGSSTPVWVYKGDADGYSWAPILGEQRSSPVVCTPDGETLAVSGSHEDHLAVLFFHSNSPTPFAVYEDAKYASTQELRLSDDGSLCIFRAGADIVRVTVATGKAESTYKSTASGSCLGISPDGATVIEGFQEISLLEWKTSAYSQAWQVPLPSSIPWTGQLSADGKDQVALLRLDNVSHTELVRFRQETGSKEVWKYSSPPRTGKYQEVPSGLGMSADGQIMAVGSWGSQDDSQKEVRFYVLDNAQPSTPILTVETLGSVSAVDLTPEGTYAAFVGKGTHANVTGNGNDVFAIQITR